LKSPHTPNNCATAGLCEHESTTMGSTFRVHKAGISGGAGAPDPGLNLRYGQMSQQSATKYKLDQNKCETTGSGKDALASKCTDEDGNVWRWPVTIVVPFHVRDWYYTTDPVPRPRPSDVPEVR
jgi:hypothetical protein